MMVNINKQINTKKDFIKLFLFKEGKVLLGKNYFNFWILCIIFFITLLAIGFSNGSLLYLEYKMNDPFINWVNIPVQFSDSEKINEVINELNTKNVQDEFLFSNVTGYFRYSLYIRNEEDFKDYYCKVRTLDINSPLLDVVYDEKNFIKGRKFAHEKDIGFIVTLKFLEDFHIPKESQFVYISMPIDDKNYRSIAIPIVAIVKELPDFAKIATTPYFYDQRFVNLNANNAFSTKTTHSLICYIKCDSLEIAKVKKDFESACNRVNSSLKNPLVNYEKFDKSYLGGYEINISFEPEPDSINKIDRYFKTLLNNEILKNYSPVQLLNFNFSEMSELKRPDYVAVNFISLDKVRDFKNYLESKYDISIDMAQIEAKENFNFVSKLTRIISLILIFFCTISISLFLTNLINNHLEKIKKNIGTFKAFGLNNSLLRNIYILIIIGFMLLSSTLSLFASYLFGILGGMRQVLKIFSNTIENNQSYFKLFDYWTLITIIIVFVISYCVIFFYTNRILKKSPGDLIYNRE